MASKLRVLFLFSSLLVHFIYAVPEPGIKEMTFDAHSDSTSKYKSFAKSLFKDATITITGDLETSSDEKGVKERQDLSLEWYLLQSDCAQIFVQVKEDTLPRIVDDAKVVRTHAEDPLYVRLYNHGVIKIKKHFSKKIVLSGSQDKDLSAPSLQTKPTMAKSTMGTLLASEKSKHNSANASPSNTKPDTTSHDHAGKRRAPFETLSKSREKREGGKPVEKLKTPKSTTVSVAAKPTKSTTVSVAAKSTEAPTKPALDGNYLLVIHLAEELLSKDSSVHVKVSMKMSTGYLSAAEWPLLPFYGAMSLVYLAYGVVWLIVSACQWRELLRIQFWIGGVIALGMLEKAVLFSEYNNVNDSGVPAHGLVVLSLVLSCIKRTLSRILIIIVSMGFGIVKPRLGGALHRVLGVGCLYFVLSLVEGSYREFSVKADVNRKQVIASVPLSVLDAVICWWIFMSLLQTMRTLRIRKNLVKLSLYRHFTNILAVSVIASVAFMIWVIKAHSFSPCITDWKEIWIDEAFWHFLFALILLAIMVLWRPTANNQRYAFTPLIDVGEDDDDDMTLSDAFQGMKMRNKGDSEAPSQAEKNRKKAEDDLKWVEENIPTSGGIDTALPSLLDSDEEIMTTKLERNKME